MYNQYTVYSIQYMSICIIWRSYRKMITNGHRVSDRLKS